MLARAADRLLLAGLGAQSAEEAANIILHFYSTYHSLRYVKDLLALRLNYSLPDGCDARLTKEFKDLLVSGPIKQTGLLPDEADEPELQHLPRLVLKFNRREFGRLLQLIHRINELGAGKKGVRPQRGLTP